MDYHSLHGHDVSSFDLPSTHRLPTVSAADALDDLDSDPSRHVSTGLPLLDEVLAAGAPGFRDSEELRRGGITKGQVTEIWGPPGVGKTTLGIQLASDALRDGKSVVWIDCFQRLCYDRLADICASASDEDGQQTSPGLEKFTHFTAPSLPHFIAIACRPTTSCIPEDTSLVVIDSFSALVNHAFPRTPEPRTPARNGNRGPSASARRFQLLQYVVGALQKLAATRNIAVVVLTQCATRMQAERGAGLIPSINANAWDHGVATRLVMFRDWAWNRGHATGLRFVGIQKVNGKTTMASAEDMFALEIGTRGLSAAHYDATQQSAVLPATKRKLGQTGFEVPDSDDEDYGWDEGEDALPGMPPQWQGSEDILLGQQPESDDDQPTADAGPETGVEYERSTAEDEP